MTIDEKIRNLQSGDVIGPFRFVTDNGGLVFVQVVGLREVVLHYATVYALVETYGVNP